MPVACILLLGCEGEGCTDLQEGWKGCGMLCSCGEWSNSLAGDMLLAFSVQHAENSRPETSGLMMRKYALTQDKHSQT